METTGLPVKLSKEPLIDAVFELRFTSNVPASSVLPGILFSKLQGVTNIEAMPASQVPPQIRAIDAQFQFAPLTRVRWKGFFILFGDNVLAVACILPYPGWKVFKDGLAEILSVFSSTDFVSTADRWSIKYTDLFDAADGATPIGQFNLGLRLGQQELSDQNFQLRVEIPRGNHLHAVQIIASATVQLVTGASKTGTLLEVDTLRNGNKLPISEFLSSFSSLADELHSANKALFFECLSAEGLKNLGPVYA